jgi:3-methyladenine DNA glycosylase AlkD
MCTDEATARKKRKHAKRLQELKADKRYLIIIKRLEALSDPTIVKGMAWAGIKAQKAYGVSMPNLRKMAKEAGIDHVLAQELWGSGIHEARIIACMIDDPKMVTKGQLESWVKGFDSWDVCDGCCGNLFDKTQFAYQKAVEWSSRQEEYVKRAGFVMMATLAVHDKKAKDDQFLKFLPMIRQESTDNRNFVKKAVNWALRQIGKRNAALNRAAIKTAKAIYSIDSKTAKWIASDALKELSSAAVQRRIGARKT